jgi:hypothetical protein
MLLLLSLLMFLWHAISEETLVGGNLREFDRRGNALVSATSACTTLATMPPFVSFRCARQLLMRIKKAKMPTTTLASNGFKQLKTCVLMI